MYDETDLYREKTNDETEADEIEDNKENDIKDNTKNDPWNKPAREATAKESNVVFAEAIKIAIKILMNNHVYTFGGEIHIQEGNGSIGD